MNLFFHEITKKVITKMTFQAGAERIELPSKVLETPMLPLYHAPIFPLEQINYTILNGKIQTLIVLFL